MILLEQFFPKTTVELSQRNLEEYERFTKIINEGRKNPVWFANYFFGIELMDYQRWCFMESWDKPFVLWLACRGSGKALAVGTPIPTPSGYTTMGELKVGDVILDNNGHPTTVSYVSPIYIGNVCYEITFDDGECIVADADHLWTLSTSDSSYVTSSTKHIDRFMSFNPDLSLCLYPDHKGNKKKIEQIVKTESVPTRCIQVDNEKGLFMCGQKMTVTHNTTLAAVFLMTKMLLIPDYQVYISTNSAAQSIEVFKKLEDIALQRIPSFASANDLFAGEVVKSANSETGFIHNPAGHTMKLYNNSGLTTLSTNLNAIRGKRGSVLYDECAWQTEEQMAATEHFADLDSSFALSTSKIKYIRPKTMPLQLLYASSAGDVEYPYYSKYVMFSKKMLMGDPNYFVCDLNAHAIKNYSSVNGVLIESHLTDESIKKAMEDDPDSAERELFNRFRKGGGENAVVSMESLIRNSDLRLPLLCNDTGKKKFILCYDPARNFDGSVLSVWQLIEDKSIGYYLQLENVISMVDPGTAKKTPLPMPAQLDIIKDTMIAYNGARAAEWENIELYIDAGAGGGGISAVADQLMADWTDRHGNKHRGVIDPDHKQYETARKTYVDAMPIVHLINPKGFKALMYSDLEKVVKLNLMKFTEYDGKDHITVELPNGEFQEAKLSQDEQMALAQINLLKNEMSYMCRYESAGGGISYDLVRDKRNTMHDDRSYTAAMAAYALTTKRRKDLLTKPKEKKSVPVFNFRAPSIKK